jgi:hypothetical protein
MHSGGAIILTVCLTLAGVGILWLLIRAFSREAARPALHEYQLGDVRLVDARNSHDRRNSERTQR